ncbi:response regulator [Amphibacillus sp. MSJ-3]|uniref:response regulator n=1 Tax=Amphibacillus sp. MSJ-3 TaxID=2841505 RepID=UPI001C0ED95D|nr:response regulator [Amphibacillus sp. MSJ-3]MBU5594319.1 response regulator [Amphibacillus sp. MSJ-3]
MLKVIIADDEQLAIYQLERFLKSSNIVELQGAYLDGYKAFEAIVKYKPDLVFLDINMPGIDGIEITKKLLEKNINTIVIFITAHDEYAIKAFEIGVTDYVLKPYTEKRIHQILHHFNNLLPPTPRNQENTVMIHTFKYLHFTKNGKEIRNIRWRTSKSRELFIYLVQNSGELVRKDVLIELLWPDIEVDKAYDNLYTTIYQMRKTLKDIGIDIDIINTVNGYEIDFKETIYDVIEWRNLMIQIEDRISDNGNLQEITVLYKKALKLYKGHYLEEEPYIWKENIKEQYRIIFLTISKSVISLLEENQKYTEAILIALHIQEIYPYLVYPYFVLMQLYDKFGDHYNVQVQYRNLNTMLEDEFGSKTDKEVQTWYRNWLQSL